LAIKRKQCVKISTGSKQLDSILLGYKLLNQTMKIELTGYRGFETMSISEIYGEFRTHHSNVVNVEEVLNPLRLRKDTNMPYHGCHCPATEGNKTGLCYFYREPTNTLQEMGGAEGKVAWIGEILPILS
jgi:hypothetical protein